MKRPVKSPRAQRSVTLPLHVWELLAQIAELQSDAYELMHGTTRYTVSDLVEAGAEMYLQSIIEDVGELPKTAEARKVFVKRLAEANQKLLADDVLGTSKT